MSELLRRQFLFTECYMKWMFWVIVVKGWRTTFAEFYVGDSINKPTEDTPHKRKGNHFNRLGGDTNLWIPYGPAHWMGLDSDDEWRLITEGGSPQWKEAGEFWESLHPLCRWGGRFQDDNHLSIESPEGMK
jgi:hypothetical protein